MLACQSNWQHSWRQNPNLHNGSSWRQNVGSYQNTILSYENKLTAFEAAR